MRFQKVTLVFCGALTGELYTLAEPRLIWHQSRTNPSEQLRNRSGRLATGTPRCCASGAMFRRKRRTFQAGWAPVYLRERRASQLEISRKAFGGEEIRNRPRPSKAVDRLIEVPDKVEPSFVTIVSVGSNRNIGKDYYSFSVFG